MIAASMSLGRDDQCGDRPRKKRQDEHHDPIRDLDQAGARHADDDPHVPPVGPRLIENPPDQESGPDADAGAPTAAIRAQGGELAPSATTPAANPTGIATT